MKTRFAALLFGVSALAFPVCAAENATPSRPKAGKVEILPLSEVKPGMKATAWTVFQGTEPEPVPIEIIGRLKNLWGPGQDVIVAKMGGKAIRTNVAGGMSGSPVYYNGKLLGAVSVRLSVHSPDAICGITPIELMLEINEYDKSRPEDARTPDKIARAREVSVQAPMLAQNLTMVPIESPLVFSGFRPDLFQEFAPVFQQMGIVAVQGGAMGSTVKSAKPVKGWETSLNPGDMVAGLLVSGDMS